MQVSQVIIKSIIMQSLNIFETQESMQFELQSLSDFLIIGKRIQTEFGPSRVLQCALISNQPCDACSRS
jgi:hypothetical protein